MIKMNFNQSERRLRVTVAVLLISVIVTLPVGFSQTVKAQTPSKAFARAESKGGQVEGIKVHGHWIIDVRNPDGKLVTHREFVNELASGLLLQQILTRFYTPGLWEIDLMTNDGISPWGTTDRGTLIGVLKNPGRITEAGQGANIFPTLVVIREAGTIVLNGTATAAVNGSIGKMATNLGTCPATTAPATCATIGPPWDGDFSYQNANMTRKLLGGSIPVVQGQIIQVNVVISFS